MDTSLQSIIQLHCVDMNSRLMHAIQQHNNAMLAHLQHALLLTCKLEYSMPFLQLSMPFQMQLEALLAFPNTLYAKRNATQRQQKR